MDSCDGATLLETSGACRPFSHVFTCPLCRQSRLAPRLFAIDPVQKIILFLSDTVLGNVVRVYGTGNVYGSGGGGLFESSLGIAMISSICAATYLTMFLLTRKNNS